MENLVVNKIDFPEFTGVKCNMMPFMYALPNTDYPKTKMECGKIITDFDKWFKNENTVNESYSNFYCS